MAELKRGLIGTAAECVEALFAGEALDVEDLEVKRRVGALLVADALAKVILRGN